MLKFANSNKKFCRRKSVAKTVFNLRFTVLLCLLCLIQNLVIASEIQANNNNGTLQFSGEHAGMVFTGEFLEWHASIILPPEKHALITASFNVASAKTGDATYDETLPEEDWFYVEKYPKSTFVSDTIVQNGAGYQVRGTLELRGKRQKIAFVLEDKKDVLEANFIVDRLAFDIGRESDASAEWVSKDIKMSLLIDKP